MAARRLSVIVLNIRSNNQHHRFYIDFLSIAACKMVSVLLFTIELDLMGISYIHIYLYTYISNSLGVLLYSLFVRLSVFFVSIIGQTRTVCQYKSEDCPRLLIFCLIEGRILASGLGFGHPG